MLISPMGFFAASGGAAAGAYELISTTVLTGNSTSVTFTSLPTTYKHLQIRLAARSDRALGVDTPIMRFNSDSGSNYAWHRLLGNGTAVSSGATASAAFLNLGSITAASATTNNFGAIVTDILDFASASKNKTIKAMAGTTETNQIMLMSGAWFNTAAVTSISIASNAGSNFIAGSRFSLYGIKG